MNAEQVISKLGGSAEVARLMGYGFTDGAENAAAGVVRPCQR